MAYESTDCAFFCPLWLGEEFGISATRENSSVDRGYISTFINLFLFLYIKSIRLYVLKGPSPTHYKHMTGPHGYLVHHKCLKPSEIDK